MLYTKERASDRGVFSFWKGFQLGLGSFATMFGAPHGFNPPPRYGVTTRQALAADWLMVGGSIRQAARRMNGKPDDD